MLGLLAWATAASLTPVVEPDQAEPGPGRHGSHVRALAAHVAARRRLRGDVRAGDRRLPADLAGRTHPPGERGYSLYSSGIEDQNYLRGVQVTDADGLVRFTSVFPACYDGRWPHVHFEVYPDQAAITDSANAIATS